MTDRKWEWPTPIIEKQNLDYQVTLTKYEKDFADAFTRLIKAGYEEDAKTILKYKYKKENT